MADTSSRQRTLAVVLAAIAVLGFFVLFEVIGTVFLAVTAAYLLVPARRRLGNLGVPRRLASGILTVGAFVAALLPMATMGWILYRRREELFSILGTLPRQVMVQFGGFQYTIFLADVYNSVRSILSSLAIEFFTALPILALKLSLFLFVLYVLLIRSDDAALAVKAPVPDHYQDVLLAFHSRVRETLYAIYVLQLATALGTFLLALPVLIAFGYPFVITIAFFAAVLQFVPIVGPSILVVALAGWELSVGADLRALGILLIGLVVIAGLPDLLIRPRLAQETAGLSGGLYFIGFVGGILTLGPIGVVAGPLIVALIVEAAWLLARETPHRTGPSGDQSVGGDGVDEE